MTEKKYDPLLDNRHGIRMLCEWGNVPITPSVQDSLIMLGKAIEDQLSSETRPVGIYIDVPFRAVRDILKMNQPRLAPTIRRNTRHQPSILTCDHHILNIRWISQGKVCTMDVEGYIKDDHAQGSVYSLCRQTMSLLGAKFPEDNDEENEDGDNDE